MSPRFVRERPWKVTFADGSYTVIDAKNKYEATQKAKPMSTLTTVDAQELTDWEAEVLERRLYRKNAPKRIRYNRGDINSTMDAALKSAKICNTPVYIETTAYGFHITQRKPPSWSPYYKVTPDGKIEKVEK
jgi:hypothetical protein